MQELALVLNRKRVRRGSIDFDLPEPLIEFDDLGAMIGVTRAPRNIAHRLIEEFMLAANECVAAHLEETANASIYRIHEKPDPKRVMEFEEVAAHFGVFAGGGGDRGEALQVTDKGRDGTKKQHAIVLADNININSRHYQKLVAKIEGKPEERILSYLMLRSLRQARYSTENAGHFALAADTYTHFTSPIRRYPDLVIHRLLRAVLLGKPTPEEGELSPIADMFAIRAAGGGRGAGTGGVEEGQVHGRAGGRGFRCADHLHREVRAVRGVDGSVHRGAGADRLDSGRPVHVQENVRKVVGKRTRREFSIGDKVRVILDRIDGNDRKLQFSLMEYVPPRGKRRHKGR